MSGEAEESIGERTMENRRKKPGELVEIVNERMRILFKLAEDNGEKNPERASRYVEIARKLGKKYLVRLPKVLKRKFCKKCNALWRIGSNVKVRLNSREKRVEYACSCGAKRYFPFVKERRNSKLGRLEGKRTGRRD
ncbi:MAG: ribonuclease P [Candidatus Micrarchaeota archaeon]